MTIRQAIKEAIKGKYKVESITISDPGNGLIIRVFGYKIPKKKKRRIYNNNEWQEEPDTTEG